MKTKGYLRYLVDNIHSTVVATVDAQGLPVTCAIDMMDCDENSLYFLTARGKSFYDRLKKNGYLALTGMKGSDTMSCVAISIRGKVRELGPERLPELFQKNPYMNRIYPSAASRQALTVFQLYEGSGEWFDLSRLPVERATFSIGDAKDQDERYIVTDRCTGCGQCSVICPQSCIDISVKPVVIQQNHCIHCGNCFEVCPANAIEKRG